MTYATTRLLPGIDMAEAEARARTALAAAGLGVLTEIDVQGTIKKKLGHDMAGYKILGACHAGVAWKAIQAEPRIGAMLPCNVLLREVEGGVEVSGVDLAASFAAVEGNDALMQAAAEGRDLLAGVIAAI